MMNLTLTRRGSFTVKVEGGADADATQCGLRGTRKFFFRVEVQCPETALDSRGFMVDQFDILKLMRTRYGKVATLPSCEMLALDACKAIHKMCPYATSIRTTIGTGPRAYMTATLQS